MRGLNREFLAMRADLARRGLIDAEHRLTAAGHAHIDALLTQLRETKAVKAAASGRVRWRTGRSL